jgi:serine/threonine protein kinase
MMSPVTPGTPGGGSRFADRYEVKNQAGVGGMGTVYQAIDRESGELIALKILHARSTIEQARFDQEARVLSELSHPGIVRYFDHGVTPNGAPYIAMEWLEGETLEDRLARGILGPSAGAQVSRLVLEALAAAHGRNIVHRDIKPGNIFLVGWKLTEIRVLDFGIARRVLDVKRLTRKGSTVGTPLYTSPEQARGRADVDGRADIFSLGCVLFEALTGDPPFTGETPLEVMTKVCAGHVPPITSRRADIPPALASLIHSMLAPDPSLRPRDANGLADEFAYLVRALGGVGAEASSGVPPSKKKRVGISEAEEHLACAMLVSLAKREDAPDTTAVADRRHGPRATIVNPSSGTHHPRASNDLRLIEIRRRMDLYACEMDRLINRTLLFTASTVSTAHEQALQLASAALALREIEPDARIAIATGRATFLGRLPVGRLMDALPTLIDGQEPGHIRIDETTRRLLPTRFAVKRDGDRIELLAEEHARDPGHESEAGGHTSPFVGRERELSSLLAVVEEAQRERISRAVLVVGKSGMGKSRLVHEALRATGAPRPTVVRGGGTLLRIERRFPTIAPVLSAAGIDPQGKSSAQVEAELAAWLCERCRDAGVLILLEDLQWADAPSVDLIDRILQAQHDKPIIVVGVGREEVEERFPGLWDSRAVQRICTRPLQERHGVQLIRHWMPSASRAAEAFILDRWLGCPLFLEELVAGARDGCLSVPDSIYAIIEGRFEGVEPDARRVLRAASLFGEKSFDIEALLCLLGEPARKGIVEWLEILIMRDFVDREIRNGRAQFRFHERLVRDAAYRMLSASDRLLARRLALAWLEGAGRTLPEYLTLPMSETTSAAASAG